MISLLATVIVKQVLASDCSASNFLGVSLVEPSLRSGHLSHRFAVGWRISDAFNSHLTRARLTGEFLWVSAVVRVPDRECTRSYPFKIYAPWVVGDRKDSVVR